MRQILILKLKILMLLLYSSIAVTFFSGCEEFLDILLAGLSGPAPPGLIYPENCQTDVTLTPTLRWYPPGDAASVQVAERRDFEHTSVDEDIYDGSGEYTVLAGSLKPYTVYFWRASIRDTSGWSSWSDPNWFRTR